MTFEDLHPSQVDRNREILEKRIALYDRWPGIRIGDFLRFADGHFRRVAHIWRVGWEDDHSEVESVQPSYIDGSRSFYLGDAYCSFSGGLLPSIPIAAFSATGEVKEGSVWFFKDNYVTAHNGIYCSAPFRVFNVAAGYEPKWG